MKFFKQYGSKERLFEMMKNVNKGLLKEDFNYNDAERDQQGQQDMTADQATNPENWNNTVPPAQPPAAPPQPKLNENDKSFDPNNDNQVKELFITLSKDGIEDIRDYYPDWVVDELYDHDYIMEDAAGGTYLWFFTEEGRSRFPDPTSLKKFLLSEFNRVTTFPPGEASYLRGREPES